MRVWGLILDCEVAGFATGERYMGVPVQKQSIHSYNGVLWCQRKEGIGAQKGDISRFKHFWHRVLAVALVGPLKPGTFR